MIHMHSTSVTTVDKIHSELTPLAPDVPCMYHPPPHTFTPFLPSQFAPLNPLLHLSKGGNEEGNGLPDKALVFSQTALMLFSQSILFFYTLNLQPSAPPHLSSLSTSLRTPALPFSLAVFYPPPPPLCPSPNTLSQVRQSPSAE